MRVQAHRPFSVGGMVLLGVCESYLYDDALDHGKYDGANKDCKEKHQALWQVLRRDFGGAPK